MKKLLYLLITLTMISCNQDFLDVKPSSNTVVPTTLEDFQQLLDYGNLAYAYPEMLDILADDYYLKGDYWSSRSNIVIKNAHVWADDIFETVESDFANWERSYSQVFYANVVIEGVQNIVIDSQNEQQYNQVKGTAHFQRAWALYILVQLYSHAYNEETAEREMGVPIPYSSDVNEKLVRSSVKKTYSEILNDLDKAQQLLSGTVDYSRPSKAAAFALSARVYLAMGKYEEALGAATNSLLQHNVLKDLNQDMPDYKSTIFIGLDPNTSFILGGNQNIQIADELYLSYGDGDLRKDYFRINGLGKPYIRSLYGLSGYIFRGLDSDEQYLIKAECQAQLNEFNDAMETLDHLLKHRYRVDTYANRTVGTKEEALSIIRDERRKELVFRGLRWSDIKRYNRDGANITLTRTMGGKVYTLPPNSDRWLFPIPANEIKTSGIPQNPR